MRKSPHALQRTEPASSRRHSGVVEVVQFWQIGGVVPWPAAVLAPGDEVAKVIGVNGEAPPFDRGGGEGRATEDASVLSDGSGDRDEKREMAGRTWA